MNVLEFIRRVDYSVSVGFNSEYYLQPTFSSVTMPLSTMVNPPMPGRTIFFKISVPKAETLIKQS